MFATHFLAGAIVARAALWPRLEAMRRSAFAVAAVGFAHRHLNHDGAWRRTLTEAVFPVYVLHQTVIVLTVMALRPAQLRPLVEGPIVIAATFSICAIGYLALRRGRALRLVFGLSPIDEHAGPDVPALIDAHRNQWGRIRGENSIGRYRRRIRRWRP